MTGVLKDIGGFYSSLYFVGLILYSQIQTSVLFTALINKLYQVEILPEHGNDSSI